MVAEDVFSLVDEPLWGWQTEFIYSITIMGSEVSSVTPYLFPFLHLSLAAYSLLTLCLYFFLSISPILFSTHLRYSILDNDKIL